ANRERQEMDHQVRVRRLVVTADEPARLEVVRRTGPGPEQEPAERDARSVAPLERRRDRDGKLRPALDVDLEVVLEVLADAGEIVARPDADSLELLCVADTGELEQLRRVDRPAAEDHLVRPDAACAASLDDLDADGAPALDLEPRHEGAAADLEIRAALDGVQVGAGRAHAPAAVDRAVEPREALLPVAVDVVG